MIPVAPGVELRVQRTGHTGATAIVLIPGWGMPGEIWGDMSTRLSRDHDVVTITPRSQPGSTMTAEGLTPEQRAEDLRAALSRLGVSRAFLIGWSLAAQDLAAFVEKFGTSQIIGMVLVDAALSAGWLEESKKQAAQGSPLHLAQIYLRNPRVYASGMTEAVVKTRPLPTIAAIMTEAVAGLPPAIGYTSMLASTFGPDRAKILATLDKPLLFVAPQASPSLPEQRQQAAIAPMGEIEVIEGAGHAVFIDQPDEFERVIRRFVSRVSQN